MDRRTFLQFATMSGVTLMAPSALQRRAHAASAYGGPYYLLIHASGGWDPTLLCDPKGSDGPTPDINKTFTRGMIGSAGAIKYAPLSGMPSGMAYSAQTFFQKYQNRLCVLNGLDTTTGNHDTGTRVVWSGEVADGFPSFAAVVAAAKTPGNPIGFISSGGYESTGGLTSLTRLGSVGLVQRIANPNTLDPGNRPDTFHSAATWDRINQMQRQRLDDMQRRQSLPRLAGSTSALYLTRSADNSLPQLAAALPTQAQINAAGSDQSGLYSQALIALAGFKTGLSVAATISPHLGFDTHGNHDGAHQPNMLSMLYGIDQIMQELQRQALDSKVVVIVGSDFGRTPAYNAQNGKDHWNITSMMFMGPGITGNRVVGSTDDSFRANTVNPSSLQVDKGGVRIRCDHVQKALRKLSGITDSDPSRKFPLGSAEDMPLFG